MKKLAFAATLMMGTSAASIAAAECGEVSITEMDWASAAVVTNVAKFLLEQGYGCSVTIVPTTTVPAMFSVAETGEPDILTELWTSYTEVYEELRGEGKLVELSKVLSDGGVEAWWIPAYLAEEHPELPIGLVELLQRWLALDPEARGVATGSMRAQLDEIWERPYGLPDNPYRGLEVYRPEDEGSFYGRVTDAARGFGGHASGCGRRCDITVFVDGDCADGSGFFSARSRAAFEDAF